MKNDALLFHLWFFTTTIGVLSENYTISFSWTSDVTFQLNSILSSKMSTTNNECLKNHSISINYIDSTSNGNYSYFDQEKALLGDKKNIIVSGLFNEMLNIMVPNLPTGLSSLSQPLMLDIDSFPKKMASDIVVKVIEFYQFESESFVIFCDTDLDISFDLTTEIVNALNKPSIIVNVSLAQISNDEIMMIQAQNVTHFVALIAPKNTLNFATFMNDHNYFNNNNFWFFLNGNYHKIASKVSFNVVNNNINLIEYSDKNQPIKNSDELILNDAVEIWFAYLRNLLCGQEISLNGTLINGSTGQYQLFPTDVNKLSWKYFVYNGFNFENARLMTASTVEVDNENIPFNPTNKFAFNYTLNDLLNNLKNNGIKYAAYIKPPYVYWNDNQTQLIGVCVEIINELCRRFNTTCMPYLLSPFPLGNTTNPTLLAYDSAMDSLILGQVDIVVGALRNLKQRNTVATPLVTLFSFNKSVLIRSERSQRNELTYLFQFIFPQDQLVWYIEIGAIFVAAIVLTLVSCCMPNKKSFNLYDSVALASFAIVMRWPLHSPDRFSSRLVVGIFWLFSLLCVLFYGCNYVAEITSVQLQADKLNFYSVPEQNSYLYGMINNTEELKDLQESQYDYPFQILKNMIVLDTIWANESVALDYVYQGGYGLIDNDPYNYYLMYQSCNLTVQNHGFSAMYTFYIRQKQFYEDAFNNILSGMVKEGFTQNVVNKYMSTYQSKNNDLCTDNKTFIGVVSNIFRYDANLLVVPYALNLEQSIGLFGILIAGCLLSIIIAIFECIIFAILGCCKKRRAKRKLEEAKDED